MKRILLLILVLSGLSGKTDAQNVFDPNDPIIRYSSSAAYGTAQKPDSNITGLQKWVSTSTNGVSSGSGSFAALAATFKAYFINYFGSKLTFRVKFPKSYNPEENRKYPVALFMHGAGEVACPSNGGIYNNEKQLVLGGRVFGQRVDDGSFDGFLVYPQLRAADNGCWGEWGSGPNWKYNLIWLFIDSMAKYAQADVDRVFVFGLSGGGIASWEMAENYSTRTASIAPTSAAGVPLTWYNLVHIPMWLATGDRDGNPDSAMAKYTVNNLNAIGASVRHSRYPDLGHASWDRHWAEQDFVSFMNNVHKANPLIFFNRFEFCPDSVVNAKIGISPGYYDYEWQRDGVTIATSYGVGAPANNNRTNTIVNSAVVTNMSSGGNELTLKSFGTYRVRFRRAPGGPWSDWSLSPAVISPKTITQTPPIQIAGKYSRAVPSLDGSTKVQLQLPGGFLNYQWVRTTDDIIVNSSPNFDAPPGTYKARYSEPFGCGTEYSPVFRVINAAGTPKPDAAKNLSVTVVSQSSLKLDWADNPNAGTNEIGFEIYRATSAGGPYSFVGVTNADMVTYTDTALVPNTEYYYLVRAIAETGAAAASNEASAKTEIDNIAPTAPRDLEYRGSTSTSVALRWKASTDNVGIERYDIYANGQKLYSTDNLYFTVANLDSLTTYDFYVKAVDRAGNESPNSNQVSGYTHRQGLNYKYYHGSFNNLPNFNNLTPVKTGVTDTVNAGAGIRTQNDNFAFLWEGLIYIPVSGNWTFETYSDDGSKLYIDVPYSFNATALVNNDGAHSAQSRTGTTYLTAGYHSIAISYAEIGGDEVMTLYWSNNVGLSRELIPKNFFSVGDQYTAAAINAPSNITATASAFNKIDLTWTDNSNNETGFEIVRSTSLTGTYVPVITTGANVTAYTDSGLNANTRYYYKIRSLINGGASAFVSAVVEGNYRFNNNFTEANGGSGLTGTNTSFNTDRPEGSHSVNLGTSGYVVLGNANQFPAVGGYDQRTVALWIKPSATNSKRMVFDIGGNDNGLGLRFNSNALIAGIASGSTRATASLNNFVSNTNWQSGQWNHVAVVYDINSLKLYLNGVLVASNDNLSFISVTGTSNNASRLGQPSTTNTNASVFNDGSYSNYTGLMDNLYIIRGALSEAEINYLRTNHTFPQSTAVTAAAPAAPAVPTNVSATVESTNTITIKFNDASSSETGFEIWRASGDKSNDRKIATLPAGDGSQITYTDSTLFANITYYYRVRATGIVSNSAFSAEVSGKTLNTKPVITRVKNFTMLYGTSFTLPVRATDEDGEALTFSYQSLPTFATAHSPENGLVNITFTPTSRQRGAYNIRVFVADGNGGRDTTAFTLNVNTNDVPVLAPIVETATINEGGLFNVSLSGTDNNGTEQMSWTFDNLPTFATFTNNNNGTSNIEFKPGYADAGEYEVTVYLNDGYGAWTSKTMTLTVVDKDPDETVQFDMRSSSPLLPGWNSVSLPDFTHPPAYNTRGNLSDVNVSLVKTAAVNAIATNGIQTGNNSGVFPDEVFKDMFTWGVNAGNNNSDTIIIKVAGLDSSKTYNFTFHTFATLNGTQTFRIGNASQSTNYFNNINGVVINDAKADANGEIFVTIIGDAAVNRGGTLSGFRIKANYADNTLPAKPTNLAGEHNANLGVKLTWVDKAYNEDAYRIYRSTERTGSYTLLNPSASYKDSSSYYDNTIAPQSTYYYYIVGINSYGTGKASDTVKVVTGNNSPIVAVTENIYLKTGVPQNIDFTVTDDPGDIVTVSLLGKPNFISLTNMGGANYRIACDPSADHIGWYYIKVKAVDNKGGEAIKTIFVTVSDKNTRSAFINFGSVGKTAPLPWNNWLGTRGSGNTLSDIRDEKNTLTTFTVTTTSGWTGPLNDLGHITGNNSGVVPDSVLASGLSDLSGPKTITIGGLDNTKKYNIVIVGSMNEGPLANVEYVSGTTRDTLNSRYNTRLTANLNGLTPSGGQIAFTSTRIGGSAANYMNALIIEEYEPTITILNPINLYAEPYDRNSIDLSWSDRTVEEAPTDGYVLERATDSLFLLNLVSISLPRNTSVYRNTGLNPNTKYWYRLRAKTSGGIFSEYSNRATAITPASIVYVNFNYTMPDAAFPWNNTYASPTVVATYEGLTNQSGASSGLSLELLRVFNGEFTAGVVTGNNSGVVPDKVLASDFWVDKTQLAQFKLSGLNHSRRYRIGFFGSAGTPGWVKGNYTGTYTINGRTVYLNSWMNSSKVVYIDNVVPDAGGNVLLDFSTTEAAMYGFHGGIIIQDYTDPESISGMQSNNSFVNEQISVLGSENANNIAEDAENARLAAAMNGKLYPNPFTDIVNIDFNNTSANNNISVEVYDLSGRLGYRKLFGKLPQGVNTLRINASEASMQTGVYIMTLSVNGKAVQANKVVRTIK